MPEIDLRDLFAMQAMNGLISSDGGIARLKSATNMLVMQGEAIEGADIVALVSYALADAMLARRGRVDVEKPLQRPNRTQPIEVSRIKSY